MTDQPDSLGLTAADYRRLAAESRAEQGLPPTIQDAATYDWLVALLTAGANDGEEP